MRYMLAALSCVVMSVMSNHAIAGTHIVLGTGLNPPLVSSRSSSGFLDSLIDEAFRRMNMSVDIVILPAERVLINANNGIEDGCVLRIRGLEKTYPNLVRVPEMMMYSEFVGYTVIAADVKGGIWASLNPYTVSYITGWKIFEMNLADHPQTVKVKNAAQLFSLLKQGRADIVLYERWQGIQLLLEAGIGDARTIEPPFATFEMFMYLNEKHRKIIPQLASVLSEIKRDGTYEAYFNDRLRSLANQYR